jgi:asparagine N-glycosylation enzyme membrane subunit Stt3
MKKKQRVLGIIIIVLMIISEVVMLLLQKNKLSSTKYNMLDISFNKILVGEIVLFVVDLIFIIFTILKKKNFKINLFISVILLAISFVFIAFFFYSYASFINAVLLIIYSNYLKINESKNKIL